MHSHVYGIVLVFSWSLTPIAYLKYASLPSVPLDNVVFEHSVLYLSFSSVIFAVSSRCMTGRALWKPKLYQRLCKPAIYFYTSVDLTFLYSDLQGLLILHCPFVLKLGSQNVKMPEAFSCKIGFVPFDVLHCISSLGPERKLQHTAISLGATPQDQTGQNKRGRKKKSWTCTEKATGRWGCKVPCLNVSVLQFLKQNNAVVTFKMLIVLNERSNQ